MADELGNTEAARRHANLTNNGRCGWRSAQPPPNPHKASLRFPYAWDDSWSLCFCFGSVGGPAQGRPSAGWVACGMGSIDPCVVSSHPIGDQGACGPPCSAAASSRPASATLSRRLSRVSGCSPKPHFVPSERPVIDDVFYGPLARSLSAIGAMSGASPQPCTCAAGGLTGCSSERPIERRTEWGWAGRVGGLAHPAAARPAVASSFSQLICDPLPMAGLAGLTGIVGRHYCVQHPPPPQTSNSGPPLGPRPIKRAAASAPRTLRARSNSARSLDAQSVEKGTDDGLPSSNGRPAAIDVGRALGNGNGDFSSGCSSGSSKSGPAAASQQPDMAPASPLRAPRQPVRPGSRSGLPEGEGGGPAAGAGTAAEPAVVAGVAADPPAGAAQASPAWLSGRNLALGGSVAAVLALTLFRREIAPVRLGLLPSAAGAVEGLGRVPPGRPSDCADLCCTPRSAWALPPSLCSSSSGW